MMQGIFSYQDRLQIASLDQRVERSHVLSSNISNAETPGFRALGYDFEDQLQAFQDSSETAQLKTSDPRHKQHPFARADGSFDPEVYVRPSESVGEDGNTVDVDLEMMEMAQNQILYRTTTEVLRRKIGMLRYAVNGGR
ncbi:MAG: flagellar basal body rod protein FlgB [Oligoflexales bacterium]